MNTPLPRLSLILITLAGIFFAVAIAFPSLLGVGGTQEESSQTEMGFVATPTPTVSSEQKAGSLDQMVKQLETRLQNQEGSADDWLLLGKTYQYLGRQADADRAYAKATDRGYDLNKLSQAKKDMNQQLKTTTPSQPLIPTNQLKMLELAALKQMFPTNSTAHTNKAEVKGTVTLSPDLKKTLMSGATLYLFAQPVGEKRGAPLAVYKTSELNFPLQFNLDDSHSVVPNRKLSDAQKVTITARLSASGNASGQPGDLEGTSMPINIFKGQKITFEINTVRS